MAISWNIPISMAHQYRPDSSVCLRQLQRDREWIFKSPSCPAPPKRSAMTSVATRMSRNWESAPRRVLLPSTKDEFMKKTELPQRSFRPYRLHEMTDGQTTSDQWFRHVDDQRSSTIDSVESRSQVETHPWQRPEFPISSPEVNSDQHFDCLTKSIEIEEALSTTPSRV